MTEFEREPGEEWLGERLEAGASEGLGGGRARPEFRSHLRSAFLAGELGASGATSSKSESRDEAGARSDQHMASIEEYLADLDPLDTPRTEFRVEARERFLEPLEVVEPGPAQKGPTPVRRSPGRRPARRSIGQRQAARTRRAAGSEKDHPVLRLMPRILIGAAAAVLFAFFLRGFDLSGSGPDPGPSWNVARLRGEGPVRIDGRDVPLTEVGGLLHEARKIETGANGLRLTWPGEFVIDLAPDTDFRADTFEMTGDTTPAFDLAAGEILVRTSERYVSGSLTFQTPEVDVRIMGTTLGIEAMPGYTCVCVCEGEVRVGAPSGEEHEVATGRSLIRKSDGEIQAFGFDRVPDSHGDPLRSLHELAPETLFP